LSAVAPEVGVPQVVGHDHHDVRPSVLRTPGWLAGAGSNRMCAKSARVPHGHPLTAPRVRPETICRLATATRTRIGIAASAPAAAIAPHWVWYVCTSDEMPTVSGAVSPPEVIVRPNRKSFHAMIPV